ncbi:PAAR motif family protein [Acinetobacter baumannii]|nr:PAAR motif family protein [Acinetobacter baumannii]
MSKGFAIHNAITDHGGMVPSTQMKSSQMGNLFVRAGDGHVCPKCRCWSTVIKSHDHVIFDGKPVAYVGDKLSCGATLLPQQSHVVGESGSPYSDIR